MKFGSRGSFYGRFSSNRGAKKAPGPVVNRQQCLDAANACLVAGKVCSVKERGRLGPPLEVVKIDHNSHHTPRVVVKLPGGRGFETYHPMTLQPVL